MLTYIICQHRFYLTCLSSALQPRRLLGRVLDKSGTHICDRFRVSQTVGRTLEREFLQERSNLLPVVTLQTRYCLHRSSPGLSSVHTVNPIANLRLSGNYSSLYLLALAIILQSFGCNVQFKISESFMVNSACSHGRD